MVPAHERTHPAERGMRQRIRSLVGSARSLRLDLACTYLLAVLAGWSPEASRGGDTEASPATLPATRPLAKTGDMAAETVAGVDRFLLQALERSIPLRARRWHRDLSSAEAYAASVGPNRERLARMIGIRDP